MHTQLSLGIIVDGRLFVLVNCRCRGHCMCWRLSPRSLPAVCDLNPGLLKPNCPILDWMCALLLRSFADLLPLPHGRLSFPRCFTWFLHSARIAMLLTSFGGVLCRFAHKCSRTVRGHFAVLTLCVSDTPRVLQLRAFGTCICMSVTHRCRRYLHTT